MKIGTIGSGFIVDQFIASARIIDDVEVIAVYSRSEERAKAFANEVNVLKYYYNLEDMLSDDNIDTIYVASPNHLHFSHALQALQAKKNVICEKPFTTNVKEFDLLVQAMQENNVMIWEAITNIHTPNLRNVKKHLHELGDIKQVICNFSQFSSKYPAYRDGEYPNVFTLECSGGSLMDINIYNVHVCLYLFGLPNTYKYYPVLGRNGIDTSGVLIFEYNNFIATLIGAKDCASENFVSIQGDEGSIRIDGASPGVCSNVTLTKIKQASENLNKDSQNSLHMSHEIDVFSNILKTNNMEKCIQLLEYSRSVLQLIEQARKEAGIFFDADK